MANKRIRQTELRFRAQLFDHGLDDRQMPGSLTSLDEAAENTDRPQAMRLSDSTTFVLINEHCIGMQLDSKGNGCRFASIKPP